MRGVLVIPWFQVTAWKFDLPLGGEITLQPFAVFIWLGLLVGMVTALLFARAHERSPWLTLDLALYLVMFSFPISYVLNAAFYLPEQFRNLAFRPVALFRAELGWSMYGGIVGSIVGAWVWRWRSRASILKIGDAAAFAGPFGWSIARVGCFLTHDHPGRTTDFFLAVADFRTGTPPYQSRHDLGLYDTLVLVGIAVVFLMLSRRPRKPGFYVGLLPVLYAPVRFFLDFLRASLSDGGDIRYVGLTPAQYGSVLLLIAGLLVVRRVANGDAAPT